MEAKYIDTHVVIWLVGGRLDIFSRETLKFIETNQLYFSSIIEFELTYLFESKKLTIPSDEIISVLKNDFGCQRNDSSLVDLISEANQLSWTRDPFDRLITAQASLQELPLITKDKTIRQNYPLAVW